MVRDVGPRPYIHAPASIDRKGLTQTTQHTPMSTSTHRRGQNHTAHTHAARPPLIFPRRRSPHRAIESMIERILTSHKANDQTARRRTDTTCKKAALASLSAPLLRPAHNPPPSSCLRRTAPTRQRSPRPAHRHQTQIAFRCLHRARTQGTRSAPPRLRSCGGEVATCERLA